jgi:uncharacterized protein (TIGR00297 family)
MFFSLLPYAFIALLALASFLLRKLTFLASLTAVVVAVCVFWGAGLTGLAMLGAFFILGVAATSLHKQEKEMVKPAADRGNRRDLRQVLANGGVAAICGLLAWLYHRPVFCTMMAGSLAAATADTLSSELGMVYGRRFYNALSFKPDRKGLDGVISLEGTVIGVTGAGLMALIYTIGFGFSGSFWIIAVAGAIGNYLDSLLGATLERTDFLNNNSVNLLNTLAGGLVALALTGIFN